MIRATATALLAAGSVMGQPTGYWDQDRCFLVTLFDTFGDGWGSDVALQVKTLHKTENLYLTCPYDEEDVSHVVCTCDPFVEFSIVDLVDRPRETWEVLWKVEPLDKNSGIYGIADPERIFESVPSYFGDYHTVLQGSIANMELNAEDPVYVHYPYNNGQQGEEEDEEYAECKPCPKPKPKPKPHAEEEEEVVYSYSNSYDYDSCPFYYSSEVSSYSVEADQASKPTPKPKALRKLQIQLHYSQEYSYSSYSSYEYSSYEFSSYEWSNSFFCRYSSYEFSSYFSYTDFCRNYSPDAYLSMTNIGYEFRNIPNTYNVVPLDELDSYPFSINYEDRWFQSEMDLITTPMYVNSGSYSYGFDVPVPAAFFTALQYVPATLTTPHYTIATEDRVHLIKEGTMCKIDGTEICEEYIPDGNYVFRVTGALRVFDILDKTDKKWTFCGVHGSWMEELPFTMENGNCYPGTKVEAYDACNAASTCTFTSNMVLRGTTDDLNAYDTALLENDLAAMLSESSGLPAKAMIESWQSTSNGLYITYRLAVTPDVHGEELLAGDFLTEIASNFDTKAANFASNGKFVSVLNAGLDNLPLNTEISINKATAVVFATAVPNGCTFSGSSKLNIAATSTVQQQSQTMLAISSLSSFQSTLGMVGIAAGLIVLSAFIAARVRNSAEEDEEETQESQRRPFAADVSRRGVELVQETVPQF